MRRPAIFMSKASRINSFSNWTQSLMHDPRHNWTIHHWNRQTRFWMTKAGPGREKSLIVNIVKPAEIVFFFNTCIFPSVNKFQFLYVPFIKLYTRQGDVNNIQLDGLLWDWRWSGLPFCDYVQFIFIWELQTVTKFWVALIEANAVFWNENRYLTNLCSYLLLIIIKIIFPSGKIDARPEVDTSL